MDENKYLWLINFIWRAMNDESRAHVLAIASVRFGVIADAVSHCTECLSTPAEGALEWFLENLNVEFLNGSEG